MSDKEILEYVDNEIDWKELAVGEEEDIIKLGQYLEYSNVPTKTESTEDGWFSLMVANDYLKEAKKLYQVYKLQQEDGDQSSDRKEDKVDEPLSSSLYSDEMEKVEDAKSSASAFLFVGIVGFIVLTACALGFIKLNMEGFSMYMFYTVMYAMLSVFIVVGIYSALNVKTIKEKVEAAKSKEQEIVDWFLKEYDAKQLDEGIVETQEIEKYFPRSEKIKNILLEKDSNLSTEQIERYLEEIYEKMFDPKE